MNDERKRTENAPENADHPPHDPAPEEAGPMEPVQSDPIEEGTPGGVSPAVDLEGSIEQAELLAPHDLGPQESSLVSADGSAIRTPSDPITSEATSDAPMMDLATSDAEADEESVNGPRVAAENWNLPAAPMLDIAGPSEGGAHVDTPGPSYDEPPALDPTQRTAAAVDVSPPSAFSLEPGRVVPTDLEVFHRESISAADARDWSAAPDEAGRPVLKTLPFPWGAQGSLEELPLKPGEDSHEPKVRLLSAQPEGTSDSAQTAFERSTPAADRGPRAQALVSPTSDGGPPLARPIVLVSLSHAKHQGLRDEALAAAATRDAKTAADLAEEKVNYALWLRVCQERAVWGR